MIRYSKARLRIGELLFDQPAASGRGVDILRYRWRPEPIGGAATEPFHTLLIGLEQEPDALLGRMNKTTRNLIRQSMKLDGLDYDFHTKPGLETVQEFFRMYEDFARRKGLGPVNRERILGFRSSGALVLSRVSAGEETLVWHCYLTTAQWCRLHHSVSLYRGSDKAQVNLVSRANRHHHWLDMLRFRESGFRTYDFGGWYTGTEDQEKLKINTFKEAFGGSVTQLFNADQALTFKGTLALHLRRALGRLRGDN